MNIQSLLKPVIFFCLLISLITVSKAQTYSDSLIIDSLSTLNDIKNLDKNLFEVYYETFSNHHIDSVSLDSIDNIDSIQKNKSKLIIKVLPSIKNVSKDIIIERINADNFEGSLEIIFENQVINANLNFRGISNLDLTFNNVVFNGEVNIVGKNINTKNKASELTSKVIANGITVGQGQSDIPSSNLDIYIENTKFKGNYFSLSIDDSYIFIDKSIFEVKGGGWFGQESRSFNDLYIKETKFIEGTYIFNSSNGNIDFEEVTFKEAVIFPSGIPFVDNSLNFNFRSVSFFDNVHFYHNIPDEINFINSHIEKEVDFSTCDKKGICLLGVLNSDISKMRLDYKYFHLTVQMEILYGIPDTTITDKLSNKKLFNRIERNYLNLLKRQKKDASFQSLKKLDLEYKQVKYGTMGISSFWDGVYFYSSKLWWNFGYEKYRVILWTILFLLILISINTLKFNYLLHNVYSSDKISNAYKSLQSKKNILSREDFFFQKIGLVTHYTSSIFFGIKLDIENFKYKNYILLLYIYFIYILGFFCIAFTIKYLLEI